MTPLAMLFMAVSWVLVLGLTFWCFRRVLRASEGRARGEGGGAERSGGNGEGTPR